MDLAFQEGNFREPQGKMSALHGRPNQEADLAGRLKLYFIEKL